MIKTILVLCILLLSAADSFARPSIRLSLVSWEPGEVKEGTVLREEITISNAGSELLEVRLRSGCSCISFDRTTKKIAPGGDAGLTVIFDTKGKHGNITEYIYFDTNDPDSSHVIFLVQATVTGKPVGNNVSEKNALSQSNEGTISLTMFSSPGCSTCRELKEHYIPELAGKHGLAIEVEYLTLDKKESYEKLIGLEISLNDENNKLPAILIGNTILGGEKEIKKELENIFKSIKEKGRDRFFEKTVAVTGGEVPGRISSIKLLPIMGAGLLDGINPCAFATIIFFISYLAFAGRGGKEILSTGISFTFAVFLCYTLIGLLAAGIIEKLSGVQPVVSLIIKAITVVMVFILGCYSIYDYIKCRQGKPGEMKLQLSPLLKDKIHKSITGRRKDFSNKDSKIIKLALAGFSVGILVSVFEFACTGQIYLPTIIYMLKLPEFRFGALGYLLLYNFMFVVPLIVIFILAWKGITSEQLSEIMLKNISKVKIGMAVFFFGMGILLILT